MMATDEATCRCPKRTMPASDVVPGGPADDRPFDAAFGVRGGSRYRQHCYGCHRYDDLWHVNILRYQITNGSGGQEFAVPRILFGVTVSLNEYSNCLQNTVKPF